MKILFNSDLDYRQGAIASIVDNLLHCGRESLKIRCMDRHGLTYYLSRMFECIRINAL